MLRRSLHLLTLLLPCACAAAQRPASRPGIVPIEIVTQVGTIDAELDSAHAPVTVTNFLRYVDSHLFDGGSFFRVVTMDNQPRDSIRIEVIQGGMRRDSSVKAFPAIPLERTSLTGLHHRNGTLSMARGGPDSARDSFFFTLDDQPALDFGGRRNPDGQGFAAFGQVTSGLDVVRRIQGGAANGQTLVAPVTIIRVSRR